MAKCPYLNVSRTHTGMMRITHKSDYVDVLRIQASRASSLFFRKFLNFSIRRFIVADLTEIRFLNLTEKITYLIV